MLRGFETYKPYINYSWSQTLTVDNNQQIKDTGTAGLNLQQFFGQGVWFNGIDQNIVLETITPTETSPIWTICFNVNTASNGKYIVRTIGSILKVLWFNSGLTYYNGSTNIKLDTTNINRTGTFVVTSDGNNIYTYLNNVLISTISQTVEQLSYGLIRDLAGNTGSNYYQGVLKDVYHFKRAFSVSDVDKYNTKPNQFFMDSLEDSSCILAMPMCEKGNLVRNYKSYSEGSNLVVNGTFDSGSNWVTQSGWSILNGKASFDGTQNNSMIYQWNVGQKANTFYVQTLTVDIQTVGGGLDLNHSGGGIPFLITQSGTYSFIVFATRTDRGATITAKTGFIGTIDNVSLKELSGIYPISNYTTTSRTNAQRLPYGLQTSGFKRDTNGMILSKSNFLEADGIGYGNTGWIPKVNEDFTVETIFEVSNDSEFRLNGNSYNNGIYFGKNSGGRNLYVRVFGSNVLQLANTKDFVYLSFSYNAQTKEVKQYIDGVLITTQLAVNTTEVNLPVLLGLVSSISATNYPMVKPIRLFKVHPKALAQAEVTKNFNTYEALGLLSESGEAIPNNAITDEDGNYFVDENGNYIVINN